MLNVLLFVIDEVPLFFSLAAFLINVKSVNSKGLSHRPDIYTVRQHCR